MKHKRKAWFLLLVFFALPLMGDEFFYKHNAGDRYRILSTVLEDVYVDRQFSHSAEIINRIAVEQLSGSEDSGTLRAVYQTAERQVDGEGSFEWSMEYISEFERNRLGYLTIGKEFFMPVVRDVPVFPGRDLRPGDTWSADGYEAHDFRGGLFGIPDPYFIPFRADYAYLGQREWKGKSYPAFSVTYRIFNEPPPVAGTIWPSRIQGSSDQIVYWDTELGQAAAYEESFRIIFELSNGMVIEYRGRAEAEIIEAPVMDKERIAEEVLEDLRRLGIPDASVRIDEAGVTINLENIQFEPDSNVLMASEKYKLDRLAQILSNYPDRDILVSGHTALAGTWEMRQQLSLERAQSVAEYLIENKVRTPDRIIIQGYGADRPLADNNTEAGRTRNRRVEITILEN
ncbi:MAG: OmpA family protein [Treponema sp.]|nr:OmpA family protein [Treponema sp.]